jgi:tRNA nucleotidyltransferase/poly(A) polymerase
MLNKKLKDLLIEKFQDNIWQVGGSVRDELLNRAPKDYDFIITFFPIKDIKENLKSIGKLMEVGVSFPVFKLNFEGAIYDFTVPRRERNTGLCHNDFLVEINDVKLEEDLMRRDFTINAIAKNLKTEELIYCSTAKYDLSKRSIEIIFDQSFVEDPLRMLRAIRFTSQIGFRLSTKTVYAIKKNKTLILTISEERIQEELNKILLGNYIQVAFAWLKETGLMEYVLPFVSQLKGVRQPTKYHCFDAYSHTMLAVMYAKKSLIIKLAALFHDVGKYYTQSFDKDEIHFYQHERFSEQLAKICLTKLKYSNDVIDTVCLLIRRHMFPEDLSDRAARKLIFKIGSENIENLLELRRADYMSTGKYSLEKIDKIIEDLTVKFEENMKITIKKQRDLAINGNYIMEKLNIKPGKRVGDILDKLTEIVLEHPEKNNINDLTLIIMKGEDE